MTLKSTTDVLICGAGAAGLSLAIDLARRGVDFRLIEKPPMRFSAGCHRRSAHRSKAPR